MKAINVVSLFEGMGCGAIALKQLGIPVNKYYSSEVDKWALMQFHYMFPEYIQVGDVNKWREWDIDWSSIDLIYGGSPCTGFSKAGKGLNFEDPQSKLFFVYVDILNHAKKHNPNVKFMLENVVMKKEWQHVINQHIGLFPVMIDAALVSAQTRKRLYWSNIRTRKEGLWGEIHTDIPQPGDRNIYLKDILESEVDERYYISNEKMLKFITDKDRLRKKHTQINGDKGITQTARQYANWNGDFICVAMFGRKLDENGIRKDNSDIKSVQRLEPNENGKTNCLTSVSKDNLILGCDIRNNEGIRIRENGKSGTLTARARIDESCGQNVIIQNGHGFNKGYVFADKSPTVTSSSWENNNHVFRNYRIRRLTTTECMKLQGIPLWYKWHPKISDSQKYKMCGNGWQCDTIEHIFSFI